MDTPITDSESLSEHPFSFDPRLPSDEPRFVEINFCEDGVGIDLYESRPDGSATVVDSLWVTRTELDGAMGRDETVTLK